MTLVWIYVAALTTFLALDAVMLTVFMQPLFQRHIGELMREPINYGAALGFYLVFIAGLIYLAVLPALAEQSLLRAVRNGAVVGLVSYGTYEASNMATLRGWSWSMVAADVTWGTLLCAAVAAVAYGVGRYVN